ncbi:reverse transcriptase family protein [Vibrio splendidus]|uniref:reverse transcriptase family protein n=1 Tax=Vibrio sp. F12 TaxID=2070776 RepID=UPI0010BD8601|nr:reverse transcriptase family protein [Vibrio sp. F12]TKE90298.1 RNA-directed DNA polymerase [Vibrio sp. F12]
MKKSKSYKINQSPLYKLTSHKKLATCLSLENEQTLRNILKRGDNNYYVSKLPNGRLIEVPKPQLNRLHRRLNKLLTRLEVPDYLNSGVKGRSNVKNARDHVGQLAVLKLDIKKFFPSITQQQIARCFVKSFSCSKDVADTLSKLCVVEGHLPTGSSISQSLAFIVNRPVFDHINIYSRSRKIKFTCYVDDLTFSGQTIPKEFCSYVTSYLKKNRGYKCHKIRVHRAMTPKSITGAVIVGNVLKVKNRHRNRIQRLLHLYNFMVKRYPSDDDKLINYFQRLQGHLYSAAQINPRYRQMGDIIVQRRCKLGVPALNQNTKK